MINLLSSYSIIEIITIIVTFALAVKGAISFWDWTKERLRKMFNKETQHEEVQHKIETLFESQQRLTETIEQIAEKVDLLIASDKDDIKAYITDKHHYYVYNQKWIDDYSLNCITERFNHYEQEGGNSFIHSLVDELKTLPKQPLQS